MPGIIITPGGNSPVTISATGTKPIYSNVGIITQGLIFHVDAGNTNSYPGSGTAVTDLTGNYNGTIQTGASGNTTYDTLGGGSWLFSGTSGRHINFGTGPILNASFTAISVVRPTSNAFNAILGRTGDAAAGFPQNFAMEIGNGLFDFASSADSYASAKSVTTVTNNVWYHVTGVYDTTINKLSIYINGAFQGQQTLTVDPPSAGTQLLVIGAQDGNSGGDPFFGYIANGLIYNRALSSGEILENFNIVRSRFGL